MLLTLEEGLGTGLALGLIRGEATFVADICSNLPARSFTRLGELLMSPFKKSSPSLELSRGSERMLEPSGSALTTRSFDLGTVNMTWTTRRSTAASTSQSPSSAGVRGRCSTLGMPRSCGAIGVRGVSNSSSEVIFTSMLPRSLHSCRRRFFSARATSSGAPQSSPLLRAHLPSVSSSQSCFPRLLFQKVASEAALLGGWFEGKDFRLSTLEGSTGEPGLSV